MRVALLTACGALTLDERQTLRSMAVMAATHQAALQNC
jgi:hypothetical protein